MGVILDSSVIIATERAKETSESLILRVIDLVGNQEVALSAIGYTEVVYGFHRAEAGIRRAIRAAFIAELKAGLPIYPYTFATAELVGQIDAEQKLKGLSIPYVDLLIGATALSLGFSIVTANERHFRMIPDLEVIPF